MQWLQRRRDCERHKSIRPQRDVRATSTWQLQERKVLQPPEPARGDSVNNYSLIDCFICSEEIVMASSSVTILNDGDNMSDHFARLLVIRLLFLILRRMIWLNRSAKLTLLTRNCGRKPISLCISHAYVVI